MTTVKPSHKLTLQDRLSRLNHAQACKLLGEQGKSLIQRGAQYEIRIPDDIYFEGDLLRVSFHQWKETAVATMTLAADSQRRLRWNCTACEGPCEHVGAMFSMVLEHKSALGLAAPPPEPSAPVELTDEEIVARAIAERAERAKTERMKIRSSNAHVPWTDYLVTSYLSGKTYRVALRGLEPGDSYCSCPDFRTNTLGTCKHLLKVIGGAKRRFTRRQLAQRYRHRRIEVHLQYGREITLRMALPDQLPPAVEELVAPLRGKPIARLDAFFRCLRKLDALEQPYHVYPDAEEYLQQQLFVRRIRDKVEEIRHDPANHPLRTTLLKVPLLPYQLDGIAFVAGAGRAVLADDMGLGKTIQGVGVAEFLAQEAGIRKVLVICPASLKSQWKNEIHRFCQRDVQLIVGKTAERTTQYNNECFFTICNYEQVLKDILSIEKTPWDLIILDEGQRIKNWEAKTTRVVKSLRSRFALVLSGTPLENRLDELYSVVQFVDDRRLGPGFRFFNDHRVLDEQGHLLGYKNLARLRELLRPVLLRRTRESVQLQLPERTSEIVRITPTAEQKELHDSHLQVVGQILAKPYLTEMDLLRLRAALLMCRLAANGTYLVTKEEPNWSSKLERLAELFDDISDESTRKVVLFSEWTTMLDLIEPLLKKRRMEFVRLDGSIPQKQRQALVHEFQTNPNCRFFLATNAGSTGLNLQSANTVINVDLPWNPAVLEQRIGRVHRMGQQRPVQIFVLVTEETLEERLLGTLSWKKDLALAALDASSEVDMVAYESGGQDLRARLEVLLGAQPEASLDKTKESDERQAINDAHRQRVAEAGGELLGAAFRLLGELVAAGAAPQPAPTQVVHELRNRLDQCVDEDSQGRPRLTFTLPDRQALDGLAQTLARLLVAGQSPPQN